MNQEIKNFLSDLYKIDKDLMKYEKELISIIEKLIEAKPDTKFDEAFKAKLKTEIMTKIADLKKQNIVKTEAKDLSGIFNSLFVNRFSFAIGGAVLVLLIMLPVLIKDGFQGRNIANKFPNISLNQEISRLDKQAFGKLGKGDIAKENGNMISQRAYGMGGGGASAGVSMDMMSSKIAPGEYFPQPINYEYVYSGTDFKLDEKEVSVMRRQKNKDAAKLFSNIINQVDIDLIDLKKFTDTELTNISINEDREFGYSYSLSPTEGISLYSNWERWPHPEQLCKDEACFASYRLKESDVPADEEMIAIADSFLKNYGVDMSHYGTGKVQAYWRQYKGVPESDVYIPEEIAVLYPLLIDGKEVYENGGSKFGLSVNVNIRYKKASAIYSIVGQNYESSNYEGVTSVDDVLSLAKKGGMQYMYRDANAAKTIKIELDTPVVAWMKYYNYDQEKGMSSELIVPALVFPVKNKPTDAETNYAYIQDSVIIPLAKEVFDQYAKERDNPQPVLYNEKPVEPATPAVDNEKIESSIEKNTNQDVAPEILPALTETQSENQTSEGANTIDNGGVNTPQAR